MKNILSVSEHLQSYESLLYSTAVLCYIYFESPSQSCDAFRYGFTVSCVQSQSIWNSYYLQLRSLSLSQPGVCWLVISVHYP